MDAGLNKEKEETFFNQIDKLFKTQFLHNFDKNVRNRSILELIEDRDFMRKDESNIFDPENVKIYMCLIIVPEMIKGYLKNQRRRCQYKLLYDCLYKYSHKKLEKLLNSEFFSFLFKEYVNSGAFQEMVENDDTLNKHKSTYEEACEYFISKITS